MSMDETSAKRCPQCDTLVFDYEPGISSVLVDGVLYHSECAVEAEALPDDDDYDEASLV